MKTSDKPFFYIIIPIFNEEENLPQLFISLEKIVVELESNYFVRILLVDDGSFDSSYKIAVENSQNLTLHVIRHEKNRGPGAAFATAFQFIKDKVEPADLVLTIEGDNTSRLDIINQMLIRMKEGYDIILASPYQYMGGVINTTGFRVFLSKIANVFIKEIVGLTGFLTVSSFFRLHSGHSIRLLQNTYGDGIINYEGFECMVEMLIKIVNLNLPVSEVPMLLDTANRKGKSKMKIMKTIFGYLSIWVEMPRKQGGKSEKVMV